MSNDLRKLFKDDPAQGYELFKAACKIADDLTTELARVGSQLEKARGTRSQSVADAIASALQPSVNAVRKATSGSVPTHVHLKDISKAREVDMSTIQHDMTEQTRAIRKARKEQK